MTNEEAIDYIEKWKTDYSVDAKDREVLSMAIKALEQQPCEDCVSREAVLDEINRIGMNAFKTYNDYSELFDFVDTLPSVTPTYDLEEYSTKLWKLAHERGKTESEEEWKDIYAESEGSNSWIEFTCPHCGNAFGIESGQYGWSYGDAIPWKACPMCGGLAEHEPYKAESEEEE